MKKRFEDNILDVTYTFDFFNLRLRTQVDVGSFLDLFDEILRHGVAQAAAANDDIDFRRVAGEIDCALAGRVAATNDCHMAIAKSGGLSGGSAVVNAGAGVLLDAGREMLAKRHTRRGEQGTRDNLAAVAQRKRLVTAVDGDAGDFKWGEGLGAEALRLSDGAAREFAAAYAGGKSEIVFNAGAGAGLAAGSMAIEEERAHCL